MKSITYHGEVDIEYAFKLAPNPSDTLIVAFPGAANAGFDNANISFNYMMTIGQFNANALYIQTNPNYSKSRMICIKREFIIERSVKALIDKCMEESNSTKVIAIGSSMGGFCALYYGLKYNWDIISGSLPYTLRDDTRLHSFLMYACGRAFDEDKKWYDGLIQTVISEAGERGYCKKIFMCWGEGEELWTSKIQAPKLLKDLEKAGIKYTYKLYPFSNHWTIASTFPSVLKAYLGYYLGFTGEPEGEKEDSDEQMVMKEIKKGYSSLLSFVKSNPVIAPNLNMRKIAYYGDTNIQNCLRNYCYIQQGWFWHSEAQSPVNIGHKDSFWGKLSTEHIKEALSFSFQSSILYLYEQKGIYGALEWCVENARQYVKYISHVADPKQNEDRWNVCRRIFFFTSLHKDMIKHGMEVDWYDEISEEILRDLHFMFSNEGLLNDGENQFKYVLGVLHGIVYFKNNKDFFDVAYNTMLNILRHLVDYCFDANGACIIRQLRHQSIFTKIIMKIMLFIDANELPENKELKVLRRKYNDILEFTAHITRPDGIIPAIGYTTYSPAWWTRNLVQRKSGNLILPSSNIAFLEDGESLSYITVNGGSNIHSAFRHCDLFSFTWFYDGKQIFADSEVGLKNVADFARSAVAHNGFICDEIDYITPDYKDWTCIDSFDEQEKYVLISMRHTLINGVIMKRHLLWIKPNVMVLYDEGTSDAEHIYTQNYVLENYHVDKSDKNKIDIKVSKEISVSITQFMADSADFELMQYSGTTDIQDTENFRGSLVTEWTKLRNGLNLAYNKKDKLAKFITAIECHGSKQAEKLETSVNNVVVKEDVVIVELNDGNCIEVKLLDPP